MAAAFQSSGNPLYNMRPATPPGADGLRYTISDIIAALTNGVAHPYVPANQSTSDAWVAKYVNNPLYKEMMGRVYGQMGYQIGNTIGGMQFIDSLGQMSGYAPEQIKRDMANAGRSFGRSALGSFVMPMADTLLNQAGLSGGSFVNMADTMFANRMSLMGPGTMYSPYDRGVQMSSMAGASAMMNLVNGLISKTDKDGKLTTSTNMAITQGFDREKIAGLVMRMAGAGAFTGNDGGFAASLQAASGKFNIENLDFASGDFKIGGAGESDATSSIGKDSQEAEKIHRFTRSFANKMKAGIEAMGAMRDLLHEVDGIEDKLTALTNGGWLRSAHGAYAARDAVRQLQAVSQVYNLDPHEALGSITQTRSVLQEAAGFGAGMQAMGFDGGGMFRLPAQTELLSDVESKIVSRGIKGDPILENRVKMQHMQAMARNMNTQAGVASQILAWGRQKGVISEEQAKEFQAGLKSGDRALMGDNINRMLTTVFGSAKIGRERMQDSLFIQGMRQDMDDAAGKFANQTITRGSDNEFLERSKITAAQSRFKFSKDSLSWAGMRTTQSKADVNKIVDSVSATLTSFNDGSEASKKFNDLLNERIKNGASREDAVKETIAELKQDPATARYAEMVESGNTAATAFREQFNARVAGGASENAALRATVNAFKKDPVTSRYAEQIEKAVLRQSTANNLYAFEKAGGLEGGQAKAMVEHMRKFKEIPSEQYSYILKMIREGHAKDALTQVEMMSESLTPAQKSILTQTKNMATQQYNARMDSVKDSAIAEEKVSAARLRGASSEDVANAEGAVNDAIRRYRKSKKTDADRDQFIDALEKSRIYSIYGKDEFERTREEVLGKKDKDGNVVKEAATDEQLDAMVKRRGRQSVELQKMASDNLRATSWGNNMRGFYGGGLYGGNSTEIDNKRASLIASTASKLTDDAVTQAGDRQTFAQDLVDFAHGTKNWKELLKVYDKSGKFTSLASDLTLAMEEAGKRRSEYNESEGDITKAVRSLDVAGKYDEANWIREIAQDKNIGGEAYADDEDLKAAVLKSNLAPDEAQKVIDALKKKREMLKENKKVDTEVEKFAEKDGATDAMREWSTRKQLAEARQKKAAQGYDDLDSYVGGLNKKSLGTGFWDKVVGNGGSAADKAYDMAKKVVSDDEVRKAHNGVDVDVEDAVSTRYKLLKQKAKAGDKGAIEAMEQFKVASAEGVTRIRGEIVLKNGNDQSPALLSGNVGGMSQ